MKHLFFFKSPLRDKILSLFLVLAAIPALLLGWLTLVLLDQAHRHDVLVIEQETLRAREEEIKKFFSNISGTLDLRLEALRAEEISIGGSSWQMSIAEAMQREHDEFREILFVSPEGRETARASRSAREGPLFYVSDLPEFQIALSGTPYRGDVYYTNDGPRVVMASPVRAGDEVVQVIIAEVDISSLVRSLTAYRIGDTGYIVIADSRGTYVGTEPFGSVKPGDRISTVLEQVKAEDRYMSVFSKTPVAAVATRVLPLDWTLVAEWPLVEADAVIGDIRNQVILVVVISIFAVVLVAPLFAARIVRPIRALEVGTRAIEKGDFSQRVFIQTGDEMEELGTSFNTMAQGLKRLQELKNEFVFVAAHELRAPATAVKGYLSMVFEGSAGALSQQMREYLTPVWKANERLGKLVDDLLEIARSEAGRLKIEVTPDDLQKSIQAVVEEATGLMREKHITLSYDQSQKLPFVYMDAVRVKEIIMNFVSNAIKYNNDGGWVRIYHEIRSAEVVTHVEDGGFGLSKEDQKHMFEKFYRAETNKTKTIKGTGLGMFITKELVEKMNGKVWFQSKEGKGSTFSFSLQKASHASYTKDTNIIS